MFLRHRLIQLLLALKVIVDRRAGNIHLRGNIIQVRIVKTVLTKIFLCDEKYYKLMRYERYGTIIMILLVATGVLGKPLDTAVEWLYNALIPIAQAGCDIIYNLFYS